MLTHTNEEASPDGRYAGDMYVLYEAPDFDGNTSTADAFMLQGIVNFFEQATNGTLKMVLVFAKSLIRYKQDEP